MTKKKTRPLAESLEVRGKRPAVPLKQQEKMTAEDCCQILQEMAEAGRVHGSNSLGNTVNLNVLQE
jgi:hypothetical protein